MDVRVALTDDEVLTLAIRAGVPWPSAVPTVDVTDPALVSAAVKRGARSLAVRGLLGAAEDDGLSEPLRALAGVLLSRRPILGTYPATIALDYSPQGMAFAYYERDASVWVSEVITPAGVHVVKLSERDWCCHTTQLLIEQAFKAEIPLTRPRPAQQPPAYLCAMGSATAGTVRLVSARPGDMRCRNFQRDGAATETVGPLTTVADAMDYLMGSKSQEPGGGTEQLGSPPTPFLEAHS